LIQVIISDWHAIARASRHLLRKHKDLLKRLYVRRAIFAISHLRCHSVRALCSSVEARAAAAASAVKSHAEDTVASLMRQLGSAQQELDDLRREQMIEMAAKTDEVNCAYDEHRNQQQQLFISSSVSSLDSWGATADFVRAKIAAMTV
jgi:hypothetical protein